MSETIHAFGENGESTGRKRMIRDDFPASWGTGRIIMQGTYRCTL